jgi:DNA-directed RNA polymerase subunit RPC12/RpoP
VATHLHQSPRGVLRMDGSNPHSLTPVFDTCPSNWYNPCLEICTRDVTTCCYFSSRRAQTTAQKALKNQRNPYRCHMCGDTNEQNFWSSLTVCIPCKRSKKRWRGSSKKQSKETQHATLSGETHLMTRPCRRCGIQFQHSKKQRLVYCPNCIVIWGQKR